MIKENESQMRRTDPFGGIRGSEINNESGKKLTPFEVDLQEALTGIQKSLDIWDGKIDPRRAGNIRERIRQKTQMKKETPYNWKSVKEYDRSLVDIYLRWSNKTIRSQKNVPEKQVRVALVGLLAFYKKINVTSPDLSHPDIIRCFNTTAKNYGLEVLEIPIDLAFDPERHIDPFAGVRGNNALTKNQFKKDLDVAVEELDFSIGYMDQLDVPTYRKEYRYKKRKPKFVKRSFKTSDSYYQVDLWWPGGPLQSLNNVPVNKARMALVSMRSFFEKIDIQNPDFNDETVQSLYTKTRERTEPKDLTNNNPEIKSIEKGGTSYWSNLTHRWVKGKLDKKSGRFIAPEKGL